MATYLIKTERLKADSYISENVDVKVVKPTIIMCQDMYIHPLLGSELFHDLLAKIQADDTLSSLIAPVPDYLILLTNYIWPCLSWYVMTEVLDVDTYKIANKAVSTKNSDNSQPATMADIDRLANKLKSKAEWYGERITYFLVANQQKYPLFLANTKIDDIQAEKGAYQSGFYLGPEPNNLSGFGPEYDLWGPKND